jgi:hypothetical protein
MRFYFSFMNRQAIVDPNSALFAGESPTSEANFLHGCGQQI